MAQPNDQQKLIRFLAQHALLGAMAGMVVTYAVLKLDLFLIGTLVERSDSGLIAVLLMFVGMAVTFSSVAMGTAIFLLPRDKDKWDQE